VKTQPHVFVACLSLAVAGTFCCGRAVAGDRPQFSVVQHDDRVTVNIDGELFTEYLTQSGRKPALWPVIGPTGKPMTRAYPIRENVPGESNDHPHHRSLWFAFEGFNGVDLWHEPDMDQRDRPLDPGRTVQSEFVEARSDGDTATIVTRNVYLNTATDKLIGKDERTLQFGTDGDARWIDYQIKIIASEGPLEIRDSKEGAFAIRVPHTMKVEAGKGGEIVASTGLTDEDAWGQPAEWIDYHGPVDGETLGIAILTHPSSYHPVPRWHVRTYGLFAVNPFGEAVYTPAGARVEPGGWENRPIVATIPEGDSLTLRYRVLFHPGDEKQGKIAEAFADYAAE
jgi:hypothetical protein